MPVEDRTPERPWPAQTAVLWYAADLGGEAALRPISSATRDEVLGELGARLDVTLPNLLGPMPPALAIPFAPRALRDFTAAALLGAVPWLATALECGRRIASGEDPLRLRQEFPAFSDLINLAPPKRQGGTAPGGDADLDRLFSMLDLGQGQAPQDAPVEAGAAADMLLARQCHALLDAPELLRLEAAWRSLALLLDACGPESGVRLFILSAPKAELAARVTQALAALDPADPQGPDAVLVAEAFDIRKAEGAALSDLARAAAESSVPIIAEAPHDLLGRGPAHVAGMHDPSTLLEGPAWGAWRGLRQREEARWLGLAWNRPWLRNGHAHAGAPWPAGLRQAGADLPGAATAVLGALIARSAARTGWPSELTAARGSEIRGPALVETILPGGRPAALAVEAPLTGDGAASLAEAGLLALIGRPDRDTITLPLAQTVKEAGRINGDSRLARHFASLPHALASGRVARALTRLHPLLRGAADPAGICAALLTTLLEDTGPGAAVEASLVPDPDMPGGSLVQLSLRFGHDVLEGASLRMDVPLD